MPSELTAEMLAELTPEQRKARLGQALLPLVQRHQPVLAVHVTGLLLKQGDDALLVLLHSEALLRQRVDEATTELAQRVEPEHSRQHPDTF